MEVKTHDIDSVKNKMAVLLEYVAALCIIVQCRTMYMHLDNLGMQVNRGVFVVLVAALTGLLLMGGIKQLPARRTLTLMAALIIYVAIFTLVNPVNRMRVLRCAVIVLLMLLMYERADGVGEGRRILVAYCRLVTAIAAVSMLLWLLISVLGVIPPSGNVITDWGKGEYYALKPTFHYIYFETQILKNGLVRATGIFVEAPMASFTYATALLINEWACRERCSAVVRSILIAAIITTFSVTGALLLGIYCLIVFFGELRRSSLNEKLVRGIMYLTGAAAFLAMLFVLHMKFAWGSGNLRVDDFLVGFRAWRDHPWFGGGWENLDYLQEHMTPWRTYLTTGYSNSPMQILAQGGVYIAAAYISALLMALISSIKNKRWNVLWLLLLFNLLLFQTTVPYQYITFLVIIHCVYASREEVNE